MATPSNKDLLDPWIVSPPTAERVAAVVSGIATIGEACNALRAEGWSSTIAGNRITVNDRVFARFIDESVGMCAGTAPRWVVYGIGDPSSALIVGSDPDRRLG